MGFAMIDKMGASKITDIDVSALFYGFVGGLWTLSTSLVSINGTVASSGCSRLVIVDGRAWPVVSQRRIWVVCCRD